MAVNDFDKSYALAIERILHARFLLNKNGPKKVTFYGIALEKFNKDELITLLEFKFGKSQYEPDLDSEPDEPIVVK